MVVRIYFIIALLFLFALPAKSTSNSGELTKVDVQLKWLHQFQFAGYYAAIEQGYYQQNGLQVNLLERKSGLSPLERLILGEVDYAISGVGAIISRTKGDPLVALAATYQHSPSILISRFPRIADLKGKKIVLSPDLMNAEITSMMAKEGIQADDFELVRDVLSVKGFVEGKHDAYNGYIANEPYQLDRLGVPYYIFKPNDFGYDFYGDILLTSEDKIQNNFNQVKLFRNSTLKGWEYAIDHVEETVDLIFNKYNSQNKTKAQLLFEAKALVKLIYANILPIGYMSEKRWGEIISVLQDTGYLAVKDVDIAPFLYSFYAKETTTGFLFLYKIELTFLFLVFLGGLLLLHNFHLKVKIAESTNQLKSAKEQAEHDARTDILTGLANRRYCMEMISHDLSIARRNGLALTLIYLDIDWFKNINDKFGHGAGDEALKVLASILKSNVRASDTPARIGGEEFVVLCLEKDEKSSVKLADRIRKEVAATTIHYDEISFQLTVSFGVASYQDGDTVDHLLQKSDQALYKAKKAGRNQVACY